MRGLYQQRRNPDEFGCNLKSSNIVQCPICPRIRNRQAQACQFCPARRRRKIPSAECRWIPPKLLEKSSMTARLTIFAPNGARSAFHKSRRNFSHRPVPRAWSPFTHTHTLPPGKERCTTAQPQRNPRRRLHHPKRKKCATPAPWILRLCK